LATIEWATSLSSPLLLLAMMLQIVIIRIPSNFFRMKNEIFLAAAGAALRLDRG
jgi:hypothetical protein